VVLQRWLGSLGMAFIAQIGEEGTCTSSRTALVTAIPIKNPPAAVAIGSCSQRAKAMPISLEEA